MNKNLEGHDFIPLTTEMEELLKRSKGDEHMHIMEALFEYAKGNYDNFSRLKKKTRRCMWKAIDQYTFIIDRYYEVEP